MRAASRYGGGTRSVASAAAAYTARGTSGAFARLEDVVEVGTRDRITVERHDGIGKVLALVGLHPGLNGRAATEEESQADGYEYRYRSSPHDSVLLLANQGPDAVEILVL